ncbi:MAG: septal ring lytic transglycosylase RlpA family protein [Micromonosporaceae bacterium]
MPGKHAADRPPTRTRLGIATAALAVLAAGSGAALASIPAADEPRSVRPPQARSPERVARDARPPHRTPSASLSRPAVTPTPKPPPVVDRGSCGTSYYDEPQGTANGERFDPDAITAAHKSLPFDTRVRVINPANGKSVVVRINDRGPYIGGRCLDLSRAAFARIAPLDSGVIHARYEVLGH